MMKYSVISFIDKTCMGSMFHPSQDAFGLEMAVGNKSRGRKMVLSLSSLAYVLRLLQRQREEPGAGGHSQRDSGSLILTVSSTSLGFCQVQMRR